MSEVLEALPELRYQYQPTDEHGRPFGGAQVILYKTQDELIQKLTEQNTLLTRKLRAETAARRTGTPVVEQIPDTAQRAIAQPIFKKRELTADERIELARDMTDPDKMLEAYRKLTEAEFGAAPEQITQMAQETQKAAYDSQVKLNVQLFLETTPEYYGCKENFDIIHNWMVKNNLEPTTENFKYAFSTLDGLGVMFHSGGTQAPVSAPVQQEVVQDGPDAYVGSLPSNARPSLTPTPQQAEPPPSAQTPVRRISTGLNNDNSSHSGNIQPTVGTDIEYVIPGRKGPNGTQLTPDRKVFGRQALDAMPSEEYGRRARTEKGFLEKAEKVLNARSQPQAGY